MAAEEALWFLYGVIAVLVLYYFVQMLFYLIPGIVRRSRDKKWSRKTRNSDKLILHCPRPAKTLPNPSPFVMKILAFLRMAGIEYEVDNTTPFGGKGKTPWISIGGKNVADSEFIIDFLKKKYGKTLNGSYSDEQIAVATSVRIMLEEHLFWGMALERFAHGSSKNLLQVMQVPALIRIGAKSLISKRSMAQGIGEHSPQDIVEIMSKDLRTVSKILGNKRFILGDEPCVEDAGIFGQLSEFVWGLPNSPYEGLINGECQNLKEYCVRIRGLYFLEWK